MPLVAIVNGSRLLAPFTSADEWTRIRNGKPLVVLACCASSGFMRTSKNGTKHFVHRVKRDIECDWERESALHLKLKERVALACKASGYATDIEVSGEDWRADVLATRGSVKIAFEIQVSPLNYPEMLVRQQKYSRDDVRACWFYKEHVNSKRYFSSSRPTTRELPAFPLDENELSVWIGDKQIDIDKAVSLLLRGSVRFSDKEVGDGSREIEFFRTQCYRCDGPTDFGYGHMAKSRCGLGMFEMDAHPLDEPARPFFQNWISEFKHSTLGKSLKLGAAQVRETPNSHMSSLSIGCHWCNVTFTREHLMRLLPPPWGLGCEHPPAKSLGKVKIATPPLIFDRPHWCVSEVRRFCAVDFPINSVIC